MAENVGCFPNGRGYSTLSMDQTSSLFSTLEGASDVEVSAKDAGALFVLESKGKVSHHSLARVLFFSAKSSVSATPSQFASFPVSLHSVLVNRKVMLLAVSHIRENLCLLRTYEILRSS